MRKALVVLASYGLAVLLATTLLGTRSLPEDAPILPLHAGPVHIALDELGEKEAGPTT